MAAENSPSMSSQYTDSASSVKTTQSQTWWRVAHMATKPSDVGRAEVAALGPRQCLITNRRMPVQLSHLVARSSKLLVLRRLQYAWGRKFSPNNRFNMFFLTLDFHTLFDSNDWALIPEPALIARIETKIRAELAVRLASGSNRAWPDFRSEEWFPIQRDKSYNYIFVPLTMAQGGVDITRRDWETVPPTSKIYDPPQYQGFPVLTSHVHPYMVILNAAPKLEKHSHLFDQAHSPELRASLQFIYNTWMPSDDSAAPESTPLDPAAGSPAPSRRSTRSRSSHPSSSRRSGLRSQHSGRSQRGVSGQSNGNPAGGNLRGNFDGQGTTDHQVNSDSAEFFGLDAEFGGSDQELDASSGTSRSALSVSVPDESITTLDHAMSQHTDYSSPKCGGHSPKVGHTSAHIDPTVRMPKDLDDWVDGANVARQANDLSAIHNLPEQLRHYTTEPARTPYVGDWHEWTSEFAPWNVLLPKRRQRGVLSSNDWAEVVKGQSLTRALEGHA